MRSIRICGICDLPALMHTPQYRLNEFVCGRTYDSFDVNEPRTYTNDRGRDVFDYDKIILGNSMQDVLPPNVSGSEALSGSDLMTKRIGSYSNGEYIDEADYISPTIEWNKLDRWHDTTARYRSSINGEHVKEFLCTPTLEQHQQMLKINTERLEKFKQLPKKQRKGKSADLIEETDMQFTIKYAKQGVETSYRPFADDQPSDEMRNAYVEGQDGFMSIKLIDDQLTRKYHARLLNVFRSRSGHVQIGSIRLERNADSTVTARCVRSDCPASLTSPNLVGLSEDEARNAMETFTWAVVAHGNNHAAKWFRERETFHKVHRLGCDGKCSEDTHYCDPSHVKNDPIVTDAEVVKFLMEHNSKCQDKNCQCADRLAELMPALAR